MELTNAQDVLDFWFLPIGVKGHNAQRPEWFRKDDQFDRQILQLQIERTSLAPLG